MIFVPMAIEAELPSPALLPHSSIKHGVWHSLHLDEFVPLISGFPQCFSRTAPGQQYRIMNGQLLCEHHVHESVMCRHCCAADKNVVIYRSILVMACGLST